VGDGDVMVGVGVGVVVVGVGVGDVVVGVGVGDVDGVGADEHEGDGVALALAAGLVVGWRVGCAGPVAPDDCSKPPPFCCGAGFPWELWPGLLEVFAAGLRAILAS
jgi:hypothetical protein